MRIFVRISIRLVWQDPLGVSFVLNEFCNFQRRYIYWRRRTTKWWDVVGVDSIWQIVTLAQHHHNDL